MRRSIDIGMTILLLISLSTSMVFAQQNLSLTELKQQINQLERVVRSTAGTASSKAAVLKDLTAKRAELRMSIQRQIGSLQSYQRSYGYRLSARENIAVTNLIRSLRMDLEGLDYETSDMNPPVVEALLSSPQERNHAQGSPLSFVVAGSAALPQDDPTPEPSASPTPPDPRVEEAKKQKIIADAEKAKFDADKAAADARKAAADADTAATAAKLTAQRAKLGLGPADADAKPAATPPSGNITAGTSPKFIETQLLAEMSARKASHQVAAGLCDVKVPALFTTPIKTLVINSSAEKLGVIKYQAILTQLQFLHTEYQRLIHAADDVRDPEKTPDHDADVCSNEESLLAAAPLLIPAATEAVKNFADLLNMFRTETEFNEQAVSVDARMIVTFLASDLASKNGRCQVEAIYYPAIYPLGVATDAGTGEIMKAYSDVSADVSAGDATVADNNQRVAGLTKKLEAINTAIAELKKKIEDDKKDSNPKGKGGKKPTPGLQPAAKPKCKDTPVGKLKQAEADKVVINAIIDRLKRDTANIDAFKTSIADVLKIMTGVNNGNPVIAELLRAERLKGVLDKEDTYALDLTVTASGTNRTRRNAFFNAKIAHSGGVSVGANLFNFKDQMVFARLEQFYVEFTGSKEIRKKTGFQELDSSFTR